MRLPALLLIWAAAAQQAPPRRPLVRPTPYVSVSGVVRDADTNEPIAGAKVKLRSASPNTRFSEADIQTGLGGGFGRTLMIEDRLLIQVQVEGYVESTAAMERGPLVIVPKPGKREEQVEIRLHKEAVIDGQVLDRETSQPLAGITVRAHWSFFDRGKRMLRPAGQAVSTSAEGRFRLAGLPPADYFLEIVPKAQERIVSLGLWRC